MMCLAINPEPRKEKSMNIHKKIITTQIPGEVPEEMEQFHVFGVPQNNLLVDSTLNCMQIT